MYSIRTGLPAGARDIWLRYGRAGLQREQRIHYTQLLETSSAALVKRISNDTYTGMRRPLVEAAEQDNVPYFVTEYYMQLLETGRAPTCEGAWGGYKVRFASQPKAQSTTRTNPEEWLQGVEHRVMRAFPSV